MKVLKLSAHELAALRTKPRMTKFWEGYFQDITVEFNKIFFDIFRTSVKVKSMQCEVYQFSDYVNHHSQDSIIQFFKIHPHNSYGFYGLPMETVDLFLTHLLGGKVAKLPQRPNLTQVDHSIVEIVSSKLVTMLEKPLLKNKHQLWFEILDIDEQLLQNSAGVQNQFICVQNYLIELEGNYYTFDLAFTHSFVDRYAIV